MKFLNNSETFDLVYDGHDYKIPNGEFEVVNDHLGHFIVTTARKWNKDVVMTAETPVKQIKAEIKVSEPETIKPIEQAIGPAIAELEKKEIVPKPLPNDAPRRGRPPKQAIGV